MGKLTANLQQAKRLLRQVIMRESNVLVMINCKERVTITQVVTTTFTFNNIKNMNKIEKILKNILK